MILSDDPVYSIKSVVQKTGLASTTLRAWERRYAVLKPGRTSGNYRLYSERDVADLCWLKDQTEGGLSISRAVAALEQARQRMAAAPAPLEADEWQRLTAQLYGALLNHNETAAYDILAQAHPLEDACLRLITPVLIQIGQGWHDGKVSIADEHFASQFLMGWLFATFNDLSPVIGPLVVAGCAPNELHQIGSLMLATILRQRGVNVRYLGADLPLDGWINTIVRDRPVVIAISCSQMAYGHTILRALPLEDNQIRGYHPKVVLGGMAFANLAGIHPVYPNVYVEPNLLDGIERIKGLLA